MRNSKGQFVKGCIAWNKNKKGYINKGSFKKGHPRFRKNYFKGIHLSLNTEFKRGIIPWNKGLDLGDNWAWNKGLGKSDRTKRMKEMGQSKYIRWRKAVFERDNFTCQNCGIKGGKLIADHIKMWCLFPKLRYNIDNGQTLCFECSKEKTKKELSIYWKNQYNQSRLP